MNWLRFLLTLLLLPQMPAADAGGLAWDALREEIVPEQLATVYAARWTFRNPTDQPVQVVAADSGCECLSVFTSDAIAPGASGFVQAFLTPKGRLGTIVKEILITSGAEKEPTRLLLVVTLPTAPRLDRSAIELTPAIPEDTLELTGDANFKQPLLVAALASSDPAVSVSIVAEQGHFRIRVRAATPLQAAVAKITLQAGYASDQLSDLRFYVRVTP